jgi:beta-lactamase class A
MIPMLTRRRLLTTTTAAVAGYALLGRPHAVRAAGSAKEQFTTELKKLEAASGGRLGVALLDTATGEQVGQRMDELFPMCSTFKLLVAGAVLSRVDAGKDDLTKRIHFGEAELVAYSPVTKERIGGAGMSMAELCEAAITHSDNTAANLLVGSLGGPARITAFARTLGDPVTRLDRVEPGLNEGRPGDVQDTTTPQAMAANLQSLVLGKVLSLASRDQLINWLVGNKTGDARLRAGLPAGWRVGDKTGGGDGTTNDVAVIWPPQGAPIIVSVYLTEVSGSGDLRNATIAAVGRAVVAAIGR